MKDNVTKFLVAFILLLCFTAGQAIVFTHSHVVNYLKHAPAKHASSSGIEENCKICHLNHDATAILNSDLPIFVIYGTKYKQQQVAALSYKSISLILAATRGPPTV